MTISAKLFFILYVVFRGENVSSFLSRNIKETDHGGHACSWPPSEHFLQIILNSEKWYQGRRFV